MSFITAGSGRGFSITVDDNDVDGKILGLAHRDLKRAARRGVTKAARFGARALKAETDSRTKRLTGTLRKSVKPGKVKTRGDVISSRVGYSGDGFYGKFLSAGTGERHKKSGASTGRLTARMLVPPATRLTDQQTPRILDREISIEIARKGL